MSNKNKFKEITNRDAWSTIRGFVYQVDTTILRWLNLADDEILELEKGEDIDQVKEGIADRIESRVLEQVKFRQSTISLNTELALELLFNFFVHKQNNPTQKLLFRFVSNAGYNIERPALWQNGKSAIVAWQEIFAETNVSVTDNRLLVIQGFLVKKITEKITDPSKTTDKEIPIQNLWNDFKTFLENSASLLQFIKEFEWSLESSDAEKVSEDVKNMISASPHVPETIDVDLLYQRLFMYVFKLLANSSTKKLDIEILKEQGLLPALNAQDQTIFFLISELLDSLQGRVSALENTVTASLDQIKSLAEDVLGVKKMDNVFEVRLRNISSTPPATLRNGSLREKKTTALLASFEQTPWINLQGINGTGKTQFAALTCRTIENIYWIELREYKDSSEKSALLIEGLLASLSGIPVTNDRNVWTYAVFSRLPRKAIIVINDLPEIKNTDPLKTLLITFASKLEEKQLRLLTTSNHKIPASVISAIPNGTFQEYNDLAFTDDEVEELLVKNGASEHVLKFAELFASISHRNPQILSTIVNRLNAINWGKDSTEVFEKLFSKEFSAEIFKDAQSTITSFITDPQTKELLYRLTLVHWGYEFDMITAISEAEDKIESVFEKFGGITNVWIEESGSTYKTSPLIHDLGLRNLSAATTKSTYGAIARSILKKKNVNLISASRIITNFIKAESYNEAAIVLLKLLRAAQNNEAAKSLYNWGYLDYWNGTEMPKEMSNSIKSHITTEQIRLRKSLGKNVDLLEHRLDKIIFEIDDAVEKTITLILILSNDGVIDTRQYLSYAKFVLENIEQLPDLFKDILTNQLIEGFVWMPLQKITTNDEVAKWLELAEMYGKVIGDSFYRNEIAEAGITVLADRIVTYEKQQVPFDPERLATRLDVLVSYFDQKGLEVFAATLLKERIALQFQIFNDAEKAEAMTIEWSEKFLTTEAKYLVYENLGKLYYNDEINPKNVAWLKKAIDLNCEHQTAFADTLAYGAASVSDSDSGLAVNYMERAVRITNDTPWASDLDKVQMNCELAFSYWKNGEYEKSYETFNIALTRLQRLKSEKFGPFWVRILSWLAHTLGYVSADVSKDKLPKHFSNGSEYTKPYQGIFLFNTKDLTDLYSPKKDVLMLAHMAVFSEGVGDIEGAYQWTLRAFDEARLIGDETLVMMVLILCGQYPLFRHKFREHFEMSLQFHAITAHTRGVTEDRYNSVVKLHYEEVLKNKPSTDWNAAEDTIFSMSILPMVIMVLNSYNENQDGPKFAHELLQLIKNYSVTASNMAMWESAYELLTKIFDKIFTADELTNEANKYGAADNRNFQVVCILGRIFLEKGSVNYLKQIVNIFPFFTRTFSNMPAILRNILVPFVKFYAIKAIKEHYVGSRQELAELIEQIENSSSEKLNAVQKVLEPAVEISEVVIEGDRREWLFNHVEI